MTQRITILKFGGTSVGTSAAIRQVVSIVKRAQGSSKTARVAVVCSAFGGVTDQLIAMSRLAAAGDKHYRKLHQTWLQRHETVITELLRGARQQRIRVHLQKRSRHLLELLNGVYLVKEVSPRTLDLIVSFGERLSNYTMAAIFQQHGLSAEYLDAREVVRTDDHFGQAQVELDFTYRAIQRYFRGHSAVQVITGFIGATVDGLTTTLGRGGSDYTAALFGAALHAKEVQIWTDVDGVMTANPRVVPRAFLVEALSYHEAMELSHFGAKVIYTPTMQPAMERKIPLRIKNTFNPQCSGTLISHTPKVSPYEIKGISAIDQIALLRIEGTGLIGVTGIAGRVFSALARQHINIILITQASSEYSICLAVLPADTVIAKRALEQELGFEIRARQVAPIVVETDRSIVAVVGENMQHTPGISGKVLTALGQHHINVVTIAQGSSELNISVVVARNDVSAAQNVIHTRFFLTQPKTIHLFLVGTGLIGGTLLDQLQRQRQKLLQDYGITIRVMALANSKAWLHGSEPLALNNWRTQLKRRGQAMQLTDFITHIRTSNLPHSVFVDCTASEDITHYYQDILQASIAIVTPNKKANSGPYQRYQTLQRTAHDHRIDFLYDTNVGAGLPIIRTLKELVASGDTVKRIEAVLSGTLSYIFNTYNGKKPFSQIVQAAHQLGYTEPDPRDDLVGMDVARKILILARETGLKLELRDITVENLIPSVCRSATSVEEFFTLLPKADAQFAKRYHQAAAHGKVLRYIATLERGRAVVQLKAVGSEHPLYRLSGSDNLVTFTTQRYHTRPLVIQGPGAGAEVTAAGVFANLIRIANKVL